MILLKEKENCCGCTACQERCPQQCITLNEDNEGFLYPVIDIKKCIDCGICEKVCPVINKKTSQKPIKIYAAQNPNEQIRLQSSSGGIFTILAEQIIKENGVVFGARFNKEWEVVHDYTESCDELVAFRGSKYVQSNINKSYQKAKDFLIQGRKVLFSATPCQISGLKLFLQKDYKNLYTIDFICHGVPSPKIWRKYLNEITQDNIQTINFRDKLYGWKNYNFSITTKTQDQKNKKTSSLSSQNAFMRGFLTNLYLRPSCHKCPNKPFKSHSDITLADFWGIQNILPSIDDDKGTSLLIFNSSRISESFFKEIRLYRTDIELVRKYNKALEYSSIPHKKRKLFFSKIEKEKSINTLIINMTKISLYDKIKKKLYTFFIKQK